MGHKKLAIMIAALGTLQTGIVNALGIGELTLKSALNQPLNAEIKLLNSGDLDETQVSVGLASTEDYINAGIDRNFFLTNVKFDVQFDDQGGGIIKLRTRKPVTDPYLNFLVETRWTSGRLLREYTVLLDLPIFSDQQVQPVEAASTPDILEQEPADLPGINNDLEFDDQYQVMPDDTLWAIAASVLPSPDASVQQTMVAIQQLNPDAFTNNNINRLKAGSILRLPTQDDLASISRQGAIDIIAQQNDTWRNGNDNLFNDDNKRQLDATRGRSDIDGDIGEMDRLSIATVGDSDSSQIGDGIGSGEGGSQALRNQLTQSRESLDKSRRENLELQSRLVDVETKLQTLQRLIELKNDQLADMQVGGSTVEESPLIEELEASLQSSSNSPAPAPAASSGTFSNGLYIFSALLLILGGGTVVALSRRKDDELTVSA